MIRDKDKIMFSKLGKKIFLGIFSVVVVGILLFFLSKSMDFMFCSNDDIYIRAILSGDLTGYPDAHTVYILYPLAWILSMLYKTFPNGNWYGGFTMGMHALCWILFLYRASVLGIHKKKQFRNFFLTFFFLCFFDLQYLISSQYTVLAGIIGCTAIFWFVTIDKEERWTAYLPVLILYSMSFLTRSKIALMFAPFFACFALFQLGYVFFEKKERKAGWKLFKTYALFTSSVILFFGLFQGIHFFAYHTAEWQTYEVYNQYRTEVYDYYSFPTYEDNVEFYDSIGIQKEEMYLIQSANLGIDENITTETMEAIYLKSRANYEWNQQFYSVPRKVVFDYLDSFFVVNKEEILLFMLYGVALILIYMERKNMIWVGFSGLFLIRTMIRGYLLYRGRFPERVSYPLTMVEILVLLAIILYTLNQREMRNNLKNKIGFYIWQVIVTAFMLLLIVDVYKENVDKNIAIKTEANWTENLFPYLEENKENNYIIEVQSMATLKAPMFGEGSAFPSNAIYIGGWLQNSPLVAKQYSNRFLLELENEMLEANNLYFIQKDSLSIAWLEEYFQIKNPEITATIVDTIELQGANGYNVIQLK